MGIRPFYCKLVVTTYKARCGCLFLIKLGTNLEFGEVGHTDLEVSLLDTQLDQEKDIHI